MKGQIIYWFLVPSTASTKLLRHYSSRAFLQRYIPICFFSIWFFYYLFVACQRIMTFKKVAVVLILTFQLWQKLKISVLGDSQCRKGLTVRGATLRGSILSGEFKSMGVVDTQKACVDLCCRSQKRCDVAMTIGRECINIRCFNKKVCTIAPAGQQTVYKGVLPVVTFVHKKPTDARKRSYGKSIPFNNFQAYALV